MASQKQQFVRTRDAIAAVRDDNLRRDLQSLLAGLEFGLESQERYGVARWCARTIGSVAFALHRTLSADVSMAIVDALSDESAAFDFLARQIGYDKQKDAACDIIPGTPTGSSYCISKLGSSCVTIEGSSGCGTVRDGANSVAFIWEFAAPN